CGGQPLRPAVVTHSVSPDPDHVESPRRSESVVEVETRARPNTEERSSLARCLLIGGVMAPMVMESERRGHMGQIHQKAHCPRYPPSTRPVDQPRGETAGVQQEGDAGAPWNEKGTNRHRKVKWRYSRTALMILELARCPLPPPPFRIQNRSGAGCTTAAPL